MDAVGGFFLPLSSIVGLGIVVATLVDASLTVLAVSSGAGPLTRMLSRILWAGFRHLNTRIGDRRLSLVAGPTIVLVVIHTWLVLMVVGWALVFGQEGSLLQDGEALTPSLGRMYYAGSLLLGGGGNFTPANAIWRFAEKVAQLNGVAFVGIAVAYVLPVVQAVVDKRKVAATIATLGRRPQDILVRAFNGRDFGDLGLHFIALGPEVAFLAQRHLAYPVIAYFHSASRETALAPSMIALDDALTLAGDVVKPDHACGPMAIEPCRRAIATFLDAATALGIHRDWSDALAPPDLEPLREAGIPLRDDQQIERIFEHHDSRRQALAAYLRHDGLDPARLYDGWEDADDADSLAWSRDWRG